MSKRKPSRARTPKPAKAKKPTGRSLRSSAQRKGAGKPRGPRSQPLPGMEQVRSGKLDNICESIHDERQTMNAAKGEEKGLIASALQVMVAKGVQVYRHGGVELARMPGAEKLRVRLTKEEGDADAGDLEQPDGGEIEALDRLAGGEGGEATGA